MNPIIKIFKTPELLAEAFADFIADDINLKDKYYISLSGGSTPKIVFKVLAERYSEKVDWSKVHFFWGDERCVPPDSDESNYKMTKDFLLDKINIPPENIHRIRGEDEPNEEAKRYSDEILKTVPFRSNLPCFDFVMLGLGEDGHTASIFPGRLDLFESDNICEAVKQPVTNQNRITITGRIINNSQQGAFLVTGKNKANIAAKILHDGVQSNNYPASYVKLNTGILYWFMDVDSSSLISL
ncbi:MAG: 6-phosphogluconolactonase [Bacteroidetes bacterium]|nr:6-phosphogluconolactonase [Bacteroidota bacterium]